ncbi:MAG: DNA alkylation repair protein [Candidatus Sericytochromatia bacterium]|nr:DNA alkylation repair protein [Candidatus Sericytochromatia bacterium]
MREPAAIFSLQARLEAARTDRSHTFWNRYMKGALPYRGVAMRDIRRAVHAWWRTEARCPEPFPLAMALLALPHGEDKLAGILLLDEIAGDAVTPGHLPMLAQAFDSGHVADWSTCDWLCLKVLGKVAARGLPDPEASRILSGWVEAPGPWRVRAALVSFIKLAARGDKNFQGFTAQMLETCDRALTWQDRFIHTGAGWLLRELAKAELQPVISFLNTHDGRLTREGLRYATEAMPPEVSQNLLSRAKG